MVFLNAWFSLFTQVKKWSERTAHRDTSNDNLLKRMVFLLKNLLISLILLDLSCFTYLRKARTLADFR